ncbi:MAG: response regulator [Deltaproteobacteria bacterium]|nr:response regulator [Deltaproteobacteria bacterium]
MTTILAVDDSATMRTCLEITFSGTAFDLVTCDGAAAFLDELAAQSPALVIIDSSLPPSSGYDLADAVRASAPEVPILMLASRQNPFDPALAISVDGYVDKPFDTQTLLEKASELIAVAAGGVAHHVEFGSPPLGAGGTLPGFDVLEPAFASDGLGFAAPPPPGATLPLAPPPPGSAVADLPSTGGDDLATTRAHGESSPLAPAFPRSVGRTMMGFPQEDELAAEPAGTATPITDSAELDAADLEFDDALPEPSAQAMVDLPLEPPPAVPPRMRGATQAWEIPDELLDRRANLVGFASAASLDASASPVMPSGDVAAPDSIESVRPREITASWETSDHRLGAAAVGAAAVGAASVDAASVDGDAFGAGAVEAAVVRTVDSPAAEFPQKLEALGLSAEQVQAVVALSREVIERVAWEVVPTLAETIIREELRRLTRS